MQLTRNIDFIYHNSQIFILKKKTFQVVVREGVEITKKIFTFYLVLNF